jgi:RimJ/RimL family protein N-acetyltransferase
MQAETERLILRPLEEHDRADLERIMGDAQVRRFFPTRATAADVDRFLARVWQEMATHGFCFGAAELKADGRLIGVIGMARFDEALQQATGAETEIGWQFDPAAWGKGLAPEGARAWLDYAWRDLGLEEVVAITAVQNRPSQRVMEKLGMVRDPGGDFDHPKIEAGHPLRRQVLYRIGNPLVGF